MICAICGQEITGYPHPWRPGQVVCFDCRVEHDPALAEEVRKQMFVFEDIVKLDTRTIQVVLRELSAQDLALALKGASQELQDVVFKNVSDNFSKAIAEEVELLGPTRISLVEEAQQKMAATVRRLVEEGTVTLQRNDSEEALI